MTFFAVWPLGTRKLLNIALSGAGVAPEGRTLATPLTVERQDTVARRVAPRNGLVIRSLTKILLAGSEG